MKDTLQFETDVQPRGESLKPQGFAHLGLPSVKKAIATSSSSPPICTAPRGEPGTAEPPMLPQQSLAPDMELNAAAAAAALPAAADVDIAGAPNPPPPMLLPPLPVCGTVAAAAEAVLKLLCM